MRKICTDSPQRGHFRRSFCYHILAVLIGILLTIVVLVVAECCLVLFDVAPPTPLFVDNTFSETPSYVVNPGYYQQFMYRLGGKPTPEDFEMWGFSIPKIKPPNTYRIVILGGSAAFGHPNPEFGFHEVLSVMLQDTVPDLNIDIYNLACPILNAYVMREIAGFCLKIEPDLFIVYMGNNEYDGPFGPAWHKNTFLANGIQQPLLRFSRKLRVLRLAQSLGRQAGWDPWKDVDGAAYFNGLLPVCRTSRSRFSMYHRFEQYVEDICTTAQQAGAQSVLCTVATNLKDWPPLVSQHAPGLSRETLHHWDFQYQKGQHSEKAGLHDKAVDAYEAAARLDAEYAALQFRLGKCHLAAGNRVQAKEALQKACDQDCYPFRADTGINTAIQNLAAKLSRRGVYFADAESYLNTTDSQGISGNGLFYDNVHLLFPGNYAIACYLFPQVIAALRKAGQDLPESIPPPTIEVCMQRIGLCIQENHRHYDCALGHLKNQVEVKAFRDSLEEHDITWLEKAVQTLSEASSKAPESARSSLEKAILNDPGNSRLRQLLIQALLREGDLSAARIQAKELVTDFKERPDAHLLHARVLEANGDTTGSTALMARLNALIHWKGP